MTSADSAPSISRRDVLSAVDFDVIRYGSTRNFHLGTKNLVSLPKSIAESGKMWQAPWILDSPGPKHGLHVGCEVGKSGNAQS